MERFTVETRRGYVVAAGYTDREAALGRAALESLRIKHELLVVEYRQNALGSWVADSAVEVECRAGKYATPVEDKPTGGLTEASLELFKGLADDAGNWSGHPPFWADSAAERGNLTDLKRKGLLSTEVDERGDAFVYFTALGIELAGEHGIDLTWVEVPA